MEYLTGGLCLDQFNIIKYCDRPFVTVGQMNEALINNINKTVGENDHLIMLGNFVFCPTDYLTGLRSIERFRNRLRVRKITLVYGNGDARYSGDIMLDRLFIRCAHYLEYITKSDISLILFHYAISNWNRIKQGAISCYAHDYGKNLGLDEENQLDVSVDSAARLLKEYRPFSVEEVSHFAQSKYRLEFQ